MLVSSAAFWLVTQFCCCIPVCAAYSHSWTFLGRGRDYTTRMSYAALLLGVRQLYRVQGLISDWGFWTNRQRARSDAWTLQRAGKG